MTDRARLEQWDGQHLWHPFTPHSVYRQEAPLLIARGQGHELIDVEGRRYLDAVGSLWCNLLGHRRPEIDQAIREQLDRIAHATLLGNSSVPAVKLARKLSQLAPGTLNKVFYSDNGSTAVEVALKMAWQYWRQTPGGERRRRFLSLPGAYHGDTLGAVSLGGIELFHERFGPLLFDVLRGPSLAQYRSGEEPAAFGARVTEEMVGTIRRHGEELAAVIIEPGMQGAGGMLPLPRGFLRRVREVTREVGTLLIADEVAMGLLRTGHLFACDGEAVVPDLLALAKGLTGGYLPLAATLASDAIFEAFLGAPERGRTFFHGHTYTGNALGCAAALATLDILDSEGLRGKLAEGIEDMREALEALSDLPAVGDIRQVGLAAGVELVMERTSKRPYPAAERRGMRVCRAARGKGVFLRPLGDVLVLMPPLTITRAELRQIIGAIRFGIQQELGTP